MFIRLATVIVNIWSFTKMKILPKEVKIFAKYQKNSQKIAKSTFRILQKW